MKAPRSARWDLVVGAIASLIAVIGLLLSLGTDNTSSLGGVAIDRETQKFLAAVAGTFLILIGIKAGLRFRGRTSPFRWSIQELRKREPR